MTIMAGIRLATTATVASAAVLIGTSAAVSGAHPRKASTRRPRTFSGQCKFTGAVRFRPPLSNTPRNLTQHVDAPGTCFGTFVGRRGRSRRLDNARARYVAAERGPGASCAGGTAKGRGELILPYGRIKFSESETRAGVFVVATAKGAASGSATGYAAPTTNQNPVTALQECAGAGIPRATVNIQLATTPSISG